jgi:hypothetical protein
MLDSQGWITMSKEIRDRPRLHAGALLDVPLLCDGTLTVRAVKPDARRTCGLLISPHATAPTVNQMDEGIARRL